MSEPIVHSTRSQPVRAALDAAQRAPSLFNTRPWTITGDGDRITLSADADRRLDAADPQSRELVISCGAALFTICTALRANGRRPEVHALPDPDRPGLLAEISAAQRIEPGPSDVRLSAAVPRRRTHRGVFAADVNDISLVKALCSAAAAEGAHLSPVTDPHLVRSLGGLVTAAEYLHRHQRPHAEEIARWARAAHDTRAGGALPRDSVAPDGVADELFPGRDYGHERRVPGILDVPAQSSGTVALLSTAGDGRADHLAAGRALQRVLLTAAAEGVAAAFHTQPLEEPPLRAFIGAHFGGGSHPQMLLRLGRTDGPDAWRGPWTAARPGG